MAGGAARVPVIGMLTEYECSSASPHTVLKMRRRDFGLYPTITVKRESVVRR